MKKRRVPVRFLGAFKMGHRPSVQDLVDDELSWELLRRVEQSDYADTEALEALDYLTRFYNELYRGVLKKNDPKAIHQTDELYKAAVGSRNAHRRCTPTGPTYSIDSFPGNKALLIPVEEYEELDEHALLTLIDQKRLAKLKS